LPADKPERSSIVDVANLAGVSPATVSKVMRGVPSVRDDNVQRVLAAVKALDYRVDPMAADMRRAKRRIIGAIVPELKSEFFGTMVTKLEEYAELAGFSLVVASSRGSEEREVMLAGRMFDWRVSGVVLAPVVSDKGPACAELARLGLTAVLVDRVFGNDLFDTVTSDPTTANHQIALRLHQFGHRHILLIALGEWAATMPQRIASFKAAMSALDADVRVDVIMTQSLTDPMRAAVSAYFDQTQPDAVYALFDQATLIALSEFRRRGWHCPNSVALVGFDDPAWMQVTWPTISTVVQPIDAIARRAVDLLLRRIAGDDGPTKPYREACTLALRGSIHGG
jgi:LacI family transcriptional regulator